MKDSTGLYIAAENISKSFGEKQVIKDLNLTIQNGEFIAIVGKSGCGKSTLLRLLSGIEDITDGEILVNGQTLKGIHPDSRLLFQDSRLLPWKTVIKNVQLSSKKFPGENALKALTNVGLADRANEWPSVLSGGQKQRVALARALVCNPKLLLLDEPLGALDALTRIEMQQLIEELWQQKKFTAILVTHDVSEAVMLADRVILIEDGAITMDVNIALARPREKNSGFAHYEKLILDRVMERRASTEDKQLIYEI